MLDAAQQLLQLALSTSSTLYCPLTTRPTFGSRCWHWRRHTGYCFSLSLDQRSRNRHLVLDARSSLFTWTFHVFTRVLDARNYSAELPVSSFNHAFSTFMLQTVLNPLDVLRETNKMLLPGGIIGITIWAKRNEPFEIWEQACKSIDPR